MAGKNNTTQKATKAEEAALADSQIFGGGETKTPTTNADAMGVVQPTAAQPEPTPTKHSLPQQEDSVTLSRSQFEEIMGRLGDLERVAISTVRANDPKSIFNPLNAVTKDHTLTVLFHGDKLVVGYKERVKPNGRIAYNWLAKNTEGAVRTYTTLLLKDIESGDVTEETVDLVEFIEGATPMIATIKERKDIGEVVEHGMVTQMTWNGSSLVPTDRQVMTGAKEQHFLFTVELGGKNYQVTEQVVNVKS